MNIYEADLSSVKRRSIGRTCASHLAYSPAKQK